MRRGFILGGLSPSETVQAQCGTFGLDRCGDAVPDHFSVTIRNGRFKTVLNSSDSQ
ncbi:hypothetical protein [Fundidesulfovibrio terrae]|uniref:hypothetical protein n=1 Tax=Fundidesulfovibrio terrae TaxID=2922866 RepID=UPI001FAEAD51|nr:hypothetical protein [Fundidesulfovibrio terrae]